MFRFEMNTEELIPFYGGIFVFCFFSIFAFRF